MSEAMQPDWNDSLAIGHEIHDFARALWPLPRSITGEGLRATLRAIQARLPALELIEVASGTGVLDWIVPDEWRIGEFRETACDLGLADSSRTDHQNIFRRDFLP